MKWNLQDTVYLNAIYDHTACIPNIRSLPLITIMCNSKEKAMLPYKTLTSCCNLFYVHTHPSSFMQKNFLSSQATFKSTLKKVSFPIV